MDGDTVRNLHVAIFRAGIGGLALAMGLQKKGVPYTIYEAAPEYSTVALAQVHRCLIILGLASSDCRISAGIGFGPNGDLALDMLQEGFRAEYDKVCVGNEPGERQDIYYEGMLLKEGLGVNEPWRGDSAWGHPDYVRSGTHRNAVLQIMTSFIPIKNVRSSKCLTNIEQRPDKVILEFADGDVAEASTLVGADGIKSIVREHVLRPLYPSQVEPVYADSYCYRGVIPTSEAKEIFGDLTDIAKMYLGDKRCCVTCLISKGDSFA